jgi:O-antigen/teichoic acid export membrane protein
MSDGWLAQKVGRYMLAAVGPIGVAGTHFVLSLVLLRLLEPAAFGTLSFLLVATQLSWGFWSALLCAPLPVFLARGTPEQREAGEATLLSLNLFGAMSAVLVFLALGLALALPLCSALCFAAFGGLALLRWFGRSYAYVHGRQMRTMGSDVAYSLTVLGGLALMLLVFGWEVEFSAYAALLAGSAVGLVSFGRAYLGRFGRWRRGLLREYAPIWRDQSRWALLGVATTEASANTHVYFVTLLHGAAAFAPLAASALLLRPVNVAQNALSDFERPQLARLIGDNDRAAIPRSLLVFRLALCGIWIGSVLVGLALFLFAPRLLFPPAYDLQFLVTASLLWAVVAALRLLQTPESALLQAAGEFKDLAMASVWASIGSVLGVLALVLFAGTLWSIAGLIAGAAIYLLWTYRYARRWSARQAVAAPA